MRRILVREVEAGVLGFGACITIVVGRIEPVARILQVVTVTIPSSMRWLPCTVGDSTVSNPMIIAEAAAVAHCGRLVIPVELVGGRKGSNHCPVSPICSIRVRIAVNSLHKRGLDVCGIVLHLNRLITSQAIIVLPRRLPI